MNTPRTKPPVRYTTPGKSKLPSGVYSVGIQNQQFAALLGTFLSLWPQIEEMMVGLFAELLEMEDEASARLVFRSIINQNTRIAIMRAMLEKSPKHKDKTLFFDEIIEEFSKLNKQRNKYVHGLWWTLEGTRSFVEEETDTYDSYLQRREVTLQEITEIAVRLTALVDKLNERRRVRGLARALASQKTPAPQESGKG